jgi:gluconokinase
MGVSGCGKSTVGQLLGERLGIDFVEGDQFHSHANIVKMASGNPLTDQDRLEWLELLADMLRQAHSSQRAVVMSCSALKKSYRNILRAGNNNVRFIYLKGTFEVLNKRVSERSHQYMPSSLLNSQLSTLEPPLIEENPLAYDVSLPPELIVDTILKELGL